MGLSPGTHKEGDEAGADGGLQALSNDDVADNGAADNGAPS